MEYKKNDYDSKEESKDIIKLSISKNEDNYLLKIFPSKDNISIIFKLEKEKIKTYYYYGKFLFDELKKINKKFKSDNNNIINIFIQIKDFTQNSICSLERKSNIMKIFFRKNNLEPNTIFILRKKIVSQNRLNKELFDEIEENKEKIKILKKQIAKLDRTIHNKNELINKMNNNIIQINNYVNNININFNTETNTSGDINIENKNNSNQKTNINQNKENKSKENDNKESKKYNILIYPNSHQNKNKIFCFENNDDILHNKKVYEGLITFNFFTSLIIIYLLYIIHDLRTNLFLLKNDFELMKKISLVKLFDEEPDDDLEGIRENIIDFQIKNDDNDDDNPYLNKKINYYKKKIKTLENKENSLLYNKRETKYFKNHIRRRIYYKIGGIDLELKYNSKEPFNFTDIFYTYKYIPEILILIRTKEGKRYGVFFSNIIFSDGESLSHKDNDYVGYVFHKNYIAEIDLHEFLDNYVIYLQNIYIYLKNEKLNIQNKQNYPSSELLGDIDIFEIYQVKYLN